MEVGAWVGASLSVSAFLAWGWLTLFRGRFWATDQRLDVPIAREGGSWPGVVAVVPARNESEVIGQTIPTVLGQRYPGPLSVYLVDDRSSDGTADIAKAASREAYKGSSFKVVMGKERPEGWAGKVWALQQGVEAAKTVDHGYFWFTDADIAHSPDVLVSLVARAEEEGLDMVSVMAKLHVSTFWDKLLIPAFVFFFGKLYPFHWVNNHGMSTAAAAGGCILVRKERLVEGGGFESMKDAIIDDCTLARLVRGPEDRGRLWLGMSQEVQSIRPYDGLRGIWDMVARTAYVQLRRSPVLLAGTILGMVWLYLGPPAAMSAGIGLAAVGYGTRRRGCPVGLGGGGMGANVGDIHADVEVVRAEPLVGTIAAYIGPSVHADDRGLGVEVLDEEGRGVEGADLLSQVPVRPALGGGGPIRRGGRRPRWSVLLRPYPRWSGLSAGRRRFREVPPPLWGRS